MPGTRKLGRVTAHRMSMLNGMVTNLLEKGEITTTYTRAKEVSALADTMITLGKKGDLASYREVLGTLAKEDVAKKLFDTIAPSYAKRAGGYTKIYKLGPRRGDAAEMALLRLVEADKTEAPIEAEAPKKKAAPRKKAAPKKQDDAEQSEAPATEETAEAKAPRKKAASRKKATAEATAEAPATETAE